MKAVADFLKSVLPPPLPAVQTVRRQSTPTQTEARVAAAAIPSTLPAAEVYETQKRRPSEDDDDAVDDDDADVDAGRFVEVDAQECGREKFGAVASPYLTPYLYKRSFLDTQYGI